MANSTAWSCAVRHPRNSRSGKMNQTFPNNMLQFGTSQRSTIRRLGALVRTNRFTLSGAILFAWGLPLFFVNYYHGIIGEQVPFHILYLSGLATFICLVSSHIILSKVGVLPLVEDKVYVLPSVTATYLITLSVFQLLIGRPSYIVATLSWMMALCWYYLIAMVRARLTHPRIAYLGGLPRDPDLLASPIEWVPITDGRLPQDVVGIVFDSDAPIPTYAERLFSRAALRHIPVYCLDHFSEVLTGRVTLVANPIAIFGHILPSQPYLRIKRVIDTGVAIPVLIVISPILALVAICIRLDSRGPGIFRQKRVGYRGRVFICFKFRTMRCGVEGPEYTSSHDPRITRFGRILRKWRIDELPQIFNIIVGDMSWIGPRPESLPLARDYQKTIPFYAYRHLVRPGITGWAAVHQGNVALEKAARRKLEFDFYYIRHFSTWLDFLIVLMTVRTVVTGFGSK